jgi:hypothetical protein
MKKLGDICFFEATSFGSAEATNLLTLLIRDIEETLNILFAR